MMIQLATHLNVKQEEQERIGEVSQNIDRKEDKK